MDASACRCDIAVGYGAEHKQTTKQWFSVHGGCLLSADEHRKPSEPNRSEQCLPVSQGLKKKIELNFNSRQHFKLSSNLSLFRFWKFCVRSPRVLVLYDYERTLY